MRINEEKLQLGRKEISTSSNTIKIVHRYPVNKEGENNQNGKE